MAIVLAVTGYLERRGEKKQEMLLRGLDYLTSDAERRNVGIAILEGLWKSGVGHRRLLLPALTNQAVYILLDGIQGESRNEFHNWLRIMTLIVDTDYAPGHRDQYCELLDALMQKIEGHEGGLAMTSTTARLWLAKVSEYAGIDHSG